MDDPRCETTSEEPDPKDFLLLSLINYMVAVNKKQIIESVNPKTKDPLLNSTNGKKIAASLPADRDTVIGNSVNTSETLVKAKPPRQTSEHRPDL